MTVDQATEADFQYFCDHPDEDQYIREFVPGEFGKRELAPSRPAIAMPRWSRCNSVSMASRSDAFAS
jgi:hypothetical protein